MFFKVWLGQAHFFLNFYINFISPWTLIELSILNEKLSRFSKTAGPGILFASKAIGVSHLVQSTRSGADFGLLFLWFVIVVSLLKYPFFEYGSLYANVTQTSIIDGYKKLGKPVLWMYFLITVASMFFVTAAVGLVTAGFFENLFWIGISWTVDNNSFVWDLCFNSCNWQVQYFG